MQERLLVLRLQQQSLLVGLLDRLHGAVDDSSVADICSRLAVLDLSEEGLLPGLVVLLLYEAEELRREAESRRPCRRRQIIVPLPGVVLLTKLAE